MKRIILLAWLFAATTGLKGGILPGFESERVTLEYVARKAEERARKPFVSPKAELPESLRTLTYDTYREIVFRREKALWSDSKSPFLVEFFHPGYLFQEPVHCYEFSLTHVQPIRFVQDFFEYRHSITPPKVPADTGYAGFRLLCQLNSPGSWDELGAFLGASYFRLLGSGQTYGPSARGLALDSGEKDRPEEFPLWTDWWLGKPQPTDKVLQLYAILDSVSCTGAYSFVIRPGSATNQPTTVVRIEAVIYAREPDQVRAVNPERKPLATIGLAPLTSMFWFGPNTERKFDDYRPAVHDSDGLLMRMEGGQMIWRPLDDGPVMRHQKFPVKHIGGFGLLQRNRDFKDYQDLFNPYQTVPTIWVEPEGTNWDDGEVHLVELSSQYEGLDNIVAFWNPATKPLPLKPYRFAYNLYWTRETDMSLSSNKVVATRVGLDPSDPSRRLFVVDFDIPGLVSEANPPRADASCGENAVLTNTDLYWNGETKTWRVILKMRPKDGNKEPVDLRCTLKKGNDAISETWSYLWSPP
jgi:glucans biosynthesis protein